MEYITGHRGVPEELRDKIKKLSNLPTLPQVAMQVMESINNPQVSTIHLAAVVSQDVAMTAKILRLANSAFYGMPRTIGSVKEAIVLLGYKVIYTLVLSLTVFDMFPRNRFSSRFDHKAFWKHSVMCGIIAKTLAEATDSRKAHPEEAFCAGVLHDVGKIVMEQYLHEDLHNAIDYGIKSSKSLYDAELALLGYSHADVGEWLISRWNLPEILFDPIVFHHTPDRTLVHGVTPDARSMHTYICHCADGMCHELKLSGADPLLMPPAIRPDCLEMICITGEKLETIRESLPEKMAEMELIYSTFTH